MEQYFKALEQNVLACYTIAAGAREKGLDPERTVPIPLARNMAERVVGLISVVAPQIAGTTVTARITELEKKYGLLDWRVGFKIAEEIAKEVFCPFPSKQEAIEVGIRVGFAYLTLGIVSAPLEGFIGLKIKKRHDGKEYFALQYAGPIRGAGGTAAATSVVLADYVRVKMGYSPYDPEEQETKRYITEIHDYHERVTNLQYHPSDDEIQFIVSHLPVEIDGDPTEKIEVSNYKDLPRITTNLIRGGAALVLAEGLCQKAHKLWKRLSQWGTGWGLSWDWLPSFIKLKEQIHASVESSPTPQEKALKPNNTYLADLVAGRPILTHPLRPGGFRLRYGRTRVSGFSAVGVHPATLIVLYRYIAIGTQLKIERPGKAATVTVCEALEGPIVRFADGSVLQLTTEEEALKHLPDVEEILYLGDLLINYGDFSENGHILVPPGYCPEWWVLDVKAMMEKKKPITLSLQESRLHALLNNPFFTIPSLEEALAVSKELNVPLHPSYTFYWKLVPADDIPPFLQWLQQGRVKTEHEAISKIILPYYTDNPLHAKGKQVLNILGVPHTVVSKENIVLAREEAVILGACFGFSCQQELQQLTIHTSAPQHPDGLAVIQSLCPFQLRDKAGTFIGARMGRPEKAKMRQMTGSPQVMFPVGEEGDRLRSFQSALDAGMVRSTFPFFFCPRCSRSMVYRQCEECGVECIPRHYCRFCGDLTGDHCRHGPGAPFKTYALDINYYFMKAKERLGEQLHPDLIKGIRGTSNKDHVVEHLAKGILRSKYGIYVNKDGTTRYDCTELPITHFKPKEIRTPPKKLCELGYTHDIYGKELAATDQILELKPQDIILPGFDSLDESAPDVLQRVAQFVDALLVQFYKMSPFYSINTPDDLVGHLVIAIAPHISAGLVGRIIGFSETQGLLTHPMFHAGLRRDCDGDEAAIILFMDALLNFSRRYLPEKRGAKTMDAPLVLTVMINPAEIDDQVHGMDVVWEYPLELYQAALEMKKPWEVKIEQLAARLGTERQYEGFGFTHPVEDFNKGVRCSAYKTQPSMEEKLLGQMEIAKKVRAVDMDDVARLVIQKHFIRDIKGNLRKFSMQQFRCVKCNEKYRRPPLSSKCTRCGNTLLFTITEGSVVKYLGPSLTLAKRYDFSPYLKQVLEITKVNIDNIFGKEKDKQAGLSTFLD